VSELTLSQINGRFQLLDRPAALPGKCAVCGAVNKPVVDFGFDLDFYGVVMFCVECLRSAAQIIGMVDGELLTRAELVQRNHEHQLEAAKDLADEYLNRFNALYVDFASRLRAVGNLSAPQNEQVSSDSATGESSDSSEDGGSEPGTTSEVTKPARNERSSSVSGSSDNGSGAIFDIP
jgi:hypothetical protein